MPGMGLLVAALAACPLPVFGPGADYHPAVAPADFSPQVTNAWFPLPPGRTWVYAGSEDGHPSVDVVVATPRTRMVDGVRTRVVEDRVYLAGRLEERTRDYFAQDRCGNVWYFGEDTAEVDRDGRVTGREGTWHAGRDGAEPGVMMQAHPELGRRFRQEWYPGHAEDTFSAVDRSVRVTVPYGRYRHALRTAESTTLEPGVLDAKVYARGVGQVSEFSVKGGSEKLHLVDVIE